LTGTRGTGCRNGHPDRRFLAKYLPVLHFSGHDAFTTTSKEIPKWTPRVVAERACIGGLGPVAIGSTQTVADELQRWIKEADIDGFNIGYVTTPGTFEEVVDLLIPELRKRGLYPEPVEEALTAREKVYGKRQRGLRSDHLGSKCKYDVYKEDPHYGTENDGGTTKSTDNQ